MGIVRKTKAVNTLLQYFEQTNKAASVVELVEDLHDEMNKTTVYRILERLESEGTLHSFMGKDGLKWYAKHHADRSRNGIAEMHPHFQCKDCGSIKCLDIQVDIPRLPNSHIESASLLLVGRCEDCM